MQQEAASGRTSPLPAASFVGLVMRFPEDAGAGLQGPPGVDDLCDLNAITAKTTLRPISGFDTAPHSRCGAGRFAVIRQRGGLMVVSTLAIMLCACSPSDVKQPRDETRMLSPRVIK